MRLTAEALGIGIISGIHEVRHESMPLPLYLVIHYLHDATLISVEN
jgi:hypothetical protein